MIGCDIGDGLTFRAWLITSLSRMRNAFRLLLPATALLLLGCTKGISRKDPADYKKLDVGLVREVQALGSHNWIVIADRSFPLYTRRGVRTILVEQQIPEVLNGVVQVLEAKPNIEPHFHRTLESSFIDNDSAPGMDVYRPAVKQILQNYEVRSFKDSYLSVLLEDNSKLSLIHI